MRISDWSSDVCSSDLYFLSRNNVRTKSWGFFGEAYWNVTDNVKVTAGLRLTRASKRAVLYPSQLLLGGGGTSGGSVSGGYPADPPLVQRWPKPTGRLVLESGRAAGREGVCQFW